MKKKRGIRIKTRVILTALGLIIAIVSMLIGAITLQNRFFPVFALFEVG